jgi:hypothetical protein
MGLSRIHWGTEDDARALFPKLDQTKTWEGFVAAVEWLMKRALLRHLTGA